MTTQHMIDVLQAFGKPGKLLEFRSRSGCETEWRPCLNPKWNFEFFDYRVFTIQPAGVNTTEEINAVVNAAMNGEEIEYTLRFNIPNSGYIRHNRHKDTFRFDQFHYRIKNK